MHAHSIALPSPAALPPPSRRTAQSPRGLRAWLRRASRRTYVVPVGRATPVWVVQALLVELRCTFPAGTVRYEPARGRLVIAGEDTLEFRQRITELRRRARPQRPCPDPNAQTMLIQSPTVPARTPDAMHPSEAPTVVDT